MKKANLHKVFAVGCIVLLSALLLVSFCRAKEIKLMKTFYVTAPWLPGKAIVASGTGPLEALTNISITVWTEDKWKEIQKIPGMPKVDEINYR